MAIRIVRNESGNCINFYGATNPTYWNACLSGEVDAIETDKVNVINDIITAQTGVLKYEFYRIDYTELVDADGNGFDSAQAAADYITEKANVTGVSADVSLIGQQIDFKLDDTSTSIMFDNGYSYGVNTIKAVPDADGTIHIKSNFSNDFHSDLTFFTGLEHTNVYVNGTAVAGGLNDVVNVLNELFTVGPFEQVVISDPYSTMVADVDGVDIASPTYIGNGIDPIGADVYGASTTGSLNGYKSAETINQAGEYFTFDIRNEAQIGFGLVHSQASYDAGYYSGSATYANPTAFGTSNSAHYGFQFSHWFHPTPNGSWTNYGANTSYVMGPAWSNSNVHFEGRDEWLAGDPIKIKVGINENGFITISSLADDGITWKLHARTGYAVPQGAEFHLGIKCGDTTGRVYSLPKIHELEEAAPTMYFRYIESPDGAYNFPLFATAEEANYYDEYHNGTTGTGTSSTLTFADDPTGTTWYRPTTGYNVGASASPVAETFQGNQVFYTEITSLTNADLAPPAYSGTNITQEEGTNVNIQIEPQGVTYSTSVDISPAGSGLVFNSGYLLSGTLSDVGADTTYTVTVTRANSYGSSVGTFTVTATDVAPTQTHTTSWTKALDFSGNSERAQQVNPNTNRNAIYMSGLGVTVAANPNTDRTVSSTSGRPWATACVFSIDGNASNQHIWNLGEGAGSTDDNIYLRVDANRNIYFGWGRTGDLNELFFGTLQANAWYGCYIAHDGTRLSGANANADNLAAAFDVRLYSAATNWQTASAPNSSTPTMWGLANSTTGGRMDRQFAGSSGGGSFTVGGRGSNRNFHGKVASMVVTTLSLNVNMPSTAEIEEMLFDPEDWIDNYKVGNNFRLPWQGTNAGFNFARNDGSAGSATQVWIMGDGSNDSYSNMIRNRVQPSNQNETKLDLISMVSNDIETVNINGLT
jgi:hypothetical protein